MANDEPKQSGFGQGYAYVGAALAFALAIVLFGGLGWLVDGWLHTRPAFALVGALVGGFGGFMSIYYRVQRDMAREKKRDEKGEG